MSITIYKYAYHVDWNTTGVGVVYKGYCPGGGATIVDLSNYYTKTNLQISGQSEVNFDNIIDAYHNNLLDIQGGLDTSSGDSSGYDAEYYHLDYTTYALLTTSPGNNKYFGTNGLGVIGWYDYEVDSGGAIYTFAYSITEDSVGVVTLVNDLDAPGNSKYYGTNSVGTKGWFDLPSFDQMDSSAITEYYVFAMSLNEDSLGVVTLDNDEESPGNSKYYGTDSGGVKGWFDLPTYETGSSGEWGIYTFDLSLIEDSVGVVTLVNDEDTPGNSMYYGTDSGGIKGWYELPEAGSPIDSSGLAYVSAYGIPVDNQIAIWIDEDTIEGNANFTFDGSTLIINGYIQTDDDPTNVKLGYEAFGQGGATGTNSFSLGSYALYSCTTGSYNVAIGNNALYSCTTGSYNVAIGDNALYSCTTSESGHIAIGYNALKYFDNIDADSSCIAIGVNTLRGTGGKFNIGIGMAAVMFLSTGDNNIVIGKNAGIQSLLEPGGFVSDLSNSIFLGNDIKSNSISGNTNQIVIGYDAIGYGSNTATLGNNNITGTYLKGAVYITDGTDGSLPAVGSDATYIVYYDPDTGALSYGLAPEESSDGGGVTLTGSTNNTICTVTGADAIQGEANLTFNGTLLNVTGTITSSGDMTATDFVLSSDEKLKTNIIPYIPKYLDIDYKQFEFKSELGRMRCGVIAQELQKKYPEFVRENADGMLSVSNDLLICEIAYLKEEIRKLKE